MVDVQTRIKEAEAQVDIKFDSMVKSIPSDVKVIQGSGQYGTVYALHKEFNIVYPFTVQITDYEGMLKYCNSGYPENTFEIQRVTLCDRDSHKRDARVLAIHGY